MLNRMSHPPESSLRLYVFRTVDVNDLQALSGGSAIRHDVFLQ